jgi:hypothetical protein
MEVTMPQLVIRGISAEEVCSVDKLIVDELEALLECPRSYFTIEVLNTVFLLDGKVAKNYPFVEISWFDRGQDLQDKVAKIVTKYIQELGHQNVDVIFRALEKNRYYENGEHF